MKKIFAIFMSSIIFFAACGGQKSEPISQNYFKLDVPTSNSKIESPVNLSGQAKGPMFFEGSFPVSIEDANGAVLGTDVAKADGEWMTDKDVPFKATINFKKSATKTGFIVLKNNNPSGLPDNEHSVKFSISFK